MIFDTTILFNLYITPRIINYGVAIFPAKSKKRFLGFFLAAVIVVIIHIVYFLATKQENLYELMQIPRVFKHEELKSSYKSLIRRNHPDKVKNDEDSIL